jgi:hypothetical protein
MSIDAILIRDRFVELGVLLPCPGDVAEIALAERSLAQTRTSDESFDGDRVEALALGLGAPAQLGIHGWRDISEGVAPP